MTKPTNYGLIPLKKSSNSNATHIFVNGFMSDHIEEIKALDWQKGIKKYTNPSPEFLNFFIIESRIPNSWYLQRL